jgi:hypothetical protein
MPPSTTISDSQIAAWKSIPEVPTGPWWSSLSDPYCRDGGMLALIWVGRRRLEVLLAVINVDSHNSATTMNVDMDNSACDCGIGLWDILFLLLQVSYSFMWGLGGL